MFPNYPQPSRASAREPRASVGTPQPSIPEAPNHLEDLVERGRQKHEKAKTAQAAAERERAKRRKSPSRRVLTYADVVGGFGKGPQTVRGRWSGWSGTAARSPSKRAEP